MDQACTRRVNPVFTLTNYLQATFIELYIAGASSFYNRQIDCQVVRFEKAISPHGITPSSNLPSTLFSLDDDDGGRRTGCASEAEEVNGGLSLVKVEPDSVTSCKAGRKSVAPTELKHPTGAPAPTAPALPCLAGAALDVAGQLRKAKSSRRNAWGNLSYADLITRAIESTPEKRLTLSQIYDWMVRYVPYFKDKGDSNSSAGWKPLRLTVADVLIWDVGGPG
ncbi:hypothetical protein P4O66_001354 [Electrophorus voltai]|uniref:Fork-head domain-containing protein n=1 Tax=Electrophorus voltai TaxID=2609070 RepID=A0AAD8Z7R5_9TELE|nr:hypothetical protein P4O66_001354 [Electrophorus voltai]